MKLPSVFIALGFCSMSSAGWAFDASSALVIQDVTVVSTLDGSLTPHQNVMLQSGRIVSVDGAKVRLSRSAHAIKGSGKYLIPGFSDMHVHAIETADLKPSFFPLLVANGITTIREESVSEPLMRVAERVNSAAAAGQLIAPEVIFQGGEEHLKPTDSALDASNAGKPSMDHLGAGWGLVLDCSSDAAAIRSGLLTQGYRVIMPPSMDFITNPRAYDAALNAPFYQRVIDTYSEDLCITLSQAFAKNATWQTLTLVRLRTQDWGDDPMYRNDPNLRYVSKQRRATWEALAERFASLPPSAIDTLHAYYGLQKHVVKLMSQNGVPILAGSDSPGIWLVPGFSLHSEFRELAAAGLSPLQVLQATTRNAAKFLHREASMGSVSVGKNADLVLLDRNPLEDVANLDKIFAVVLKGRYMSAAELEQMKREVAAAYQ